MTIFSILNFSILSAIHCSAWRPLSSVLLFHAAASDARTGGKVSPRAHHQTPSQVPHLWHTSLTNGRIVTDATSGRLTWTVVAEPVLSVACGSRVGQETLKSVPQLRVPLRSQGVRRPPKRRASRVEVVD